MSLKQGRIEDIKFTSLNVTAATSGNALYTDRPINGEIVEVKTSFNQGGSLVLAGSSDPTKVIMQLNASSGTNPIYSHPTVFGQSSAGSIAGATQFPFVVNDVLQITTGSLVSGTAATLTAQVFYR